MPAGHVTLPFGRIGRKGLLATMYGRGPIPHPPFYLDEHLFRGYSPSLICNVCIARPAGQLCTLDKLHLASRPPRKGRCFADHAETAHAIFSVLHLADSRWSFGSITLDCTVNHTTVYSQMRRDNHFTPDRYMYPKGSPECAGPTEHTLSVLPLPQPRPSPKPAFALLSSPNRKSMIPLS
jgi:hypothetical protein